jgi:hypothetical protein
MHFNPFEQERRFRAAWESVTIERGVSYSLFTFGESVLPYLLVCGPRQAGKTVSLTRGEVRIARPAIITPESARPEFRNFFDSPEEEGFVQFLLARTAAFSHLKFDNRSGEAQTVTDSVEETVAKLNRQLDAEDEDRVAILSAPHNLGGLAVVRYATERVWASTPGNLQELRERGLLP